MIKDIVEQEPKGVPVPLPAIDNAATRIRLTEDEIGYAHIEKETPSKRLRSRHRKMKNGVSLKEWASRLRDADDINLVQRWYANKRRRATKKR